MKCDLHTHTFFSDGFCSPEYIIKEAKKQKLKAIAITDHNTIEALSFAETTAKKENIELITGVEINAEGTELLGYFFDKTYEPLLKILDENKKSINDVVIQKIYWLKDNGYDIEIENVLKHTGPTKNLMSTHLAIELQKKGYVVELFEAFTKIIKKINVDYKPKRTSAKKIIKEITNANGVCVLPHPWLLPATIKSNFENYLLKLQEHGLLGVETTGPITLEQENFLKEAKETVKRLELLECGGSDFHSLKHFPDNIIGKYTVDYSVVEKLKAKTI